MNVRAKILILRHGATEWSKQKKLQGRSDIPLSAHGRQQVAGWRIPTEWCSAVCLSSPLKRARQTAELLGFPNAGIESQLIESDWGTFEGRRLDCLRRELGEEMAANESRGLDFRPPNGESPREVAHRVRRLFETLARTGGRFILVTHKGVRNASIVLATGWDMSCKPPVRLGDEEAMAVRLSPGGTASFDGIVPLT